MSGDTIDDIPVGLKTRVTKTVSESDVYLFAGITEISIPITLTRSTRGKRAWVTASPTGR